MTRLRPILLPLLVLAVALGVTWLVWNHEQQTSQKELRSQFDFSLRDAVSRIDQRMAAYEQMLRGVQGLFVATGKMDRDSFHGYVGSLQLDANFAGIQAIGVAERVPEARKNAHVEAMHRRGLSDYAILPEGHREIFAPVIHVEPDFDSNRISLGFDPWTDPVRRLAMERARDSGMPAISGKIPLAIMSETQPGFIMYLPIFAQGQPLDSVNARRTHLIGWVFAAISMRNLMAGLYGEQLPGLALAIYDDLEASADTLLYQSVPPRDPHSHAAFSANEYLVVAGHTWMFSMSTQDDFEVRYGRNAESFIAIAGIGLSLLLALLVWLMVTSRARAMRLATTMTKELRASEQRWNFALEG
ncbi:MAG: CHASE domain-containing protein, partial [Betaproteobacteria bacterium]